MSLKTNIGNLLDAINCANEATKEYFWKSKKHYRKYGCGVNLDHPKGEEELHIAYAYHEYSTYCDVVYTLLDVFQIDSKKLFIAARALRKFYERTGYERCPDERMIEAFERFLEG